MKIVRVAGSLPDGFERLILAARAEGVRNLDRLKQQWASHEQRFDRDGAALFAAYVDDELIGLGGVTPETGLAEPAMRMRRFYIHPVYRRKGHGGELARAVMDYGLSVTPLLTGNARATPQAGPFWEALGFRQEYLPNITHIYRKS